MGRVPKKSQIHRWQGQNPEKARPVPQSQRKQGVQAARALNAPPPVPPRALPTSMPEPGQQPRSGRQVWTCRAGFEPHLFEELSWAGANPRLLGEALVESDARSHLHPAFGRMGFKLWEAVEVAEGESAAEPSAEVLKRHLQGRPAHLQAWTLDTARANPLSGQVEALRQAVLERLRDVPLLESASQAWQREGLLLQLCAVSKTLWLVGAVPATEAASLAPGGRQRMRRDEQAPSRASAKLEEALELMGLAPSPTEVCADLGAAPGGWTQRLLARGATVLAVDPAKLAPHLQNHRKLRHFQESAFAFAPEEPLDWLFCDMAWRPLEVAQLLAKWGRRRWALYLVANIKLPMKDKNPVLHRVRHTLEEAGWKHLVVRQLYHDRDEVTVLGRRD